MRWLATALVALVATLGVASEWKHLQAWRLRARAEKSYYAGDFATTLARYDAVIDRRAGEPRSHTDPADTISQYLSGAGQELPMDEFERLARVAVLHYLHALDASPPGAWSFARLAVLADALGRRRTRGEGVDLARLSGNVDTLTPEDRFEEAARVKAVRIEPRNFYYRDQLADFYLRRGFRDRAMDQIRFAVRLHPVLDRHYYLGEFAEASPDILNAVELGVQDALAADDTDVSPYDIHRRLAAEYVKLERFEDALDAFERAAEVAPFPGLVQIDLGQLHSRLGNEEQALESFERAAELSPEHPRAWLHLSLSLSRLGRHDAAVDAAYRARGLDPTDFTISLSVARVLKEAELFDESAGILEHLIRAHPNRQQAYGQLIRLYEDQRRLVEAARIARQLADRFPDEPAYRRQAEQLERLRSKR